LALIAVLLWFCLVFQISCRSREASWDRLYSDARLELERGDGASAFTKAEQGLRESAHSSDNSDLWRWKFLVLKAETLLWRPDNSEVVRLLTPLPPPDLLGGELLVRAKAIKGMALAYLREDDFEAEKLLSEAVAQAAKVAPYLQCEGVLYEGNLAWRRMELPLAEQLFRKSLQLATDFKQSFIEAGALNQLGIILITTGRYDEGIEQSFKSLDLSRSAQYRLVENIALSNLAWGYQELGDLKKAMSYFSEQEKILDSLGNEQLKENVLNNMGETQFALGDYAAAQASYSKALAIAQEMDRKKKSGEKFHLTSVLNDVAEVALEEGQIEKAAEYNQQASALGQRIRRTMLISGKVAGARGQLADAKSLFGKLVKDNGNQEFDSEYVRWDAEAELAKVLAIEHRNTAAELQFQHLVDSVEAARSALHLTEHKLAFSSHAGRYYDDYIRFLFATEQPRKAFQVAEFSRARTLAEGVGLKAPARPSDIRIEAVQAFLAQRKKTILAYWLAPEHSFLWVISPSRFKLFTLAGEQEIAQKIEQYNQTLLGRENIPELEREGQGLYELLVAPAQQFIPHDAKLIVIADGALNRLNFETVRVPATNPHYWIEDVELEMASSTPLLLSPGKRPPIGNRKILLIGNPTEASTDYPALRHAKEEMQKIENHFIPDHEIVVSGKDATPSSYRSSHPENFDIIHFDTHGTAHELSPLESAIILSPQDQNSFKLYARDIVKTRINADIVTVSACYGAGTRTYSGEGLVGLAWAFLRAGAHRVVAGLWEVDELASVDLMDDFYSGLQAGQTASGALRSAKLKMLKSDGSYSRPYYWASLQLYVGS